MKIGMMNTAMLIWETKAGSSLRPADDEKCKSPNELPMKNDQKNKMNRRIMRV